MIGAGISDQVWAEVLEARAQTDAAMAAAFTQTNAYDAGGAS